MFSKTLTWKQHTCKRGRSYVPKTRLFLPLSASETKSESSKPEDGILNSLVDLVHLDSSTGISCLSVDHARYQIRRTVPGSSRITEEQFLQITVDVRTGQGVMKRGSEIT